MVKNIFSKIDNICITITTNQITTLELLLEIIKCVRALESIIEISYTIMIRKKNAFEN